MNNTRIRFNWGFHDAANDHKIGRCQLTGVRPAAYQDGYKRGLSYAQQGLATESSDPAWADRRREAEERKNMRPGRSDLRI